MMPCFFQVRHLLGQDGLVDKLLAKNGPTWAFLKEPFLRQCSVGEIVLSLRSALLQAWIGGYFVPEHFQATVQFLQCSEAD